MHGPGGNGKKTIFSEINITPLTDIFLVLLIIMMVVAPMMQQSRKDIKPPSLQSGKPVEQGKLTVEITGDGSYYVAGKPATYEELPGLFKAEAPKMEEKNVIIRADKATKSAAVLRVFEAARDAAFEKVTVAGEALDGKRQQELQQQQPETGAPTS